MNDQSQYETKIKKEDLKPNMEFKVLTHVSKFINDSVEKDFLLNCNNTLTQKNKSLPKLKNNFKFTTKNSFNSSEKKFHDTKGNSSNNIANKKNKQNYSFIKFLNLRRKL